VIKRLRAGLGQFDLELSAEKLHQQIAFSEELLRWNRRINLTAIRNPEEALEKHLLDSLLLLNYVTASGRLLDMGSGGGLPGIPLAIARPELQLVSVDAVGKKISFQKHIQRKLGLNNFQPLHARLEEIDRFLSPAELFDQAVARAFTSLPLLCALARPWLKKNGELLAMKGPEGEAELAEISGQLGDLGYGFGQRVTYRLPFSQAERQLIVLKKL
jgi:16S rRNA (guanine527-N7)-methyltransferase